jgi:hypothetical protein
LGVFFAINNFAINNPYAAIAMRNVTFLGVDAIRDLPSRKLQRLKMARIRSRLQRGLLEAMTGCRSARLRFPQVFMRKTNQI